MANNELIGKQFKNFTVLEIAAKDARNRTYFLCKCVCGSERQIRKDNLGKIRDCGCRNAAKGKTPWRGENRTTSAALKHAVAVVENAGGALEKTVASTASAACALKKAVKANATARLTMRSDRISDQARINELWQMAETVNEKPAEKCHTKAATRRRIEDILMQRELNALDDIERQLSELI
jgi:hypothetical protein